MKEYIASICIACYNIEKYVDGLFENISKLEWLDKIQLIFINDGSRDNTYNKVLENIKKYHLDDNSIALTQQHYGISNVRNKMIDIAEGKYIFFLDGDDKIAPDSIKKLYLTSQKLNKDIVTSRSHVIFNKKYSFPFIVQYRYVRNMTSNHYVKSNLCTPWGTLFNKKVFENYTFLEKYNFEDIGLLNFIFLNNDNFTYIKDITYYYYRHENSLSTFNEYNRWNVIDLYEQVKYAFSLYNSKNWLKDKVKLRFINGTFFQILISIYWLSKHYTNNKNINYLPTLSILSIFNENNVRLKYSKTFWKSLSYFYIKTHLISYDKRIKIRDEINKHFYIFKTFEEFEKSNLKKNSIVYINNEFKPNNKYKNICFFSTNITKPADNNVFLGIKPIEITSALIENEKIYFIDLTHINKLNTNEIDIIYKINKRLLVLINKDLKHLFKKDQFNFIYI